MNFLRQQADAFLKARPDETEEPPPLPEVEDLEMDAAIAEMKERLENMRAQTMLQRLKQQRELEQLKAQQQTARQRLKTSVATAVARAHTAPYLAATKRANGGEMVPGVVVTLQAQFCLHLHGICVHAEQLLRAKRDSSDVLFWFEDMVKFLRQSQADKEMQLMNDLVQAKIYMGELVDAKRLKDRETSTANSYRRTLSRKFSRNNNNLRRSSLTMKSARMRSRRFSNNLQTGGEELMNIPIQTGGNRHRIVRKISTRGTVLLQKNGSVKNWSVRNLQRGQSIRKSLNNFSLPHDNELGDTSMSESENTLGSHVSVRRVPSVENAAKAKDALSPAISEGDESENGSGGEASGLEPPSENIVARRAARTKARRAGSNERREGRPIRRGIERTRSKSLTSAIEERRAGRRPKQSHDDTNVRRSSGGLLVGFPQPRAKDDSNSMMTRRGSTRELLRGFSPPPHVEPISPVSSTHSSSSEQHQSLTSTFRNWMTWG